MSLIPSYLTYVLPPFWLNDTARLLSLLDLSSPLSSFLPSLPRYQCSLFDVAILITKPNDGHSTHTRVAGLMEHRQTIRKLDLDSSHLPRSPMGPRPPIVHPACLTPSSTILRSARPMSPIPRSPSPRTHRQRAIADQIEILRLQMLEAEREGVKDHIGMSEMSDKLSWLREQQEGSWALGLTDVTPLGYDRYMTWL